MMGKKSKDKVIPKLCVFCYNFDLYTGSSSTFDESAGAMRCTKDHFNNKDEIFPSSDEGDLRSIIFKAETCPDYKQVQVK